MSQATVRETDMTGTAAPVAQPAPGQTVEQQLDALLGAEEAVSAAEPTDEQVAADAAADTAAAEKVTGKAGAAADVKEDGKGAAKGPETPEEIAKARDKALGLRVQAENRIAKAKAREAKLKADMDAFASERAEATKARETLTLLREHPERFEEVLGYSLNDVAKRILSDGKPSQDEVTRRLTERFDAAEKRLAEREAAIVAREAEVQRQSVLATAAREIEAAARDAEAYTYLSRLDPAWVSDAVFTRIRTVAEAGGRISTGQAMADVEASLSLLVQKAGGASGGNTGGSDRVNGAAQAAKHEAATARSSTQPRTVSGRVERAPSRVLDTPLSDEDLDAECVSMVQAEWANRRR